MSRLTRHLSPAALVVLVLASVLGLAACKASSPTSPNPPTQLTGQNPNENPSFNGTLTIFGGGLAPADGNSDVGLVVEVRDANGNPAANLTPVVFSTSLGTIRPIGADPATAGSSTQVTTWGGQAGALLRSAVAGSATVTVAVANRFTTAIVQFEPTASTDVMTLAFRRGTDISTVSGTTPFLETIVASVTDPTGAPLTGRTVRFKIVSNSADAELTGAPRSVTDANGEAFNVLRARRVGTVSLLAELLDSSDNVVKESNQIIATITAESSDVRITLNWGTTGTLQTTSSTAPNTLAMRATVTDGLSGNVLSGRRVQFNINSDTATTTPAQLTTTKPTLTDGSGVATNQLDLFEGGTSVAVEAVLLDSAGATVARSNQIFVTVTGESSRFQVSLAWADDTTTTAATVVDTIGMTATVKDTQSNTTLSGRSVKFRIVSDTAAGTKSSLANTGTTFTDGAGQAANALTISEAGSVAVVVADLVDASGAVLATSNQITIEGE